MASFNSGYYGGGGYNFESTSARNGGARGDMPGDVVYDDRSMDDDFSPSPMPGYHPAPRQSRPPRPRDDRREAYDDYRPGTTLGMSDDGFDDDFDDTPKRRGDGFDDDFDDPRAMAQRRSPAMPDRRAGQRMGYSRYDDYDERDFDSEFAGIRGIGGRRPEPPRRDDRYDDRYNDDRRGGKAGLGRSDSRRADDYDDYDDYDDTDGYYGRASIRDRAYHGEPGVPKIFADYFRDDDDYVVRKTRSGKNKSSTSAASKRRRAMIVAASVLLVAALTGSTIAYFSLFRMSSPLNVTTALTSIGGTTSAELIKSNVDETLAQKNITVSYPGKSGTLSLSSCEFQYSTEEDGTEKVVEADLGNGNKTNYKYKTIGSIKFNETKVREFLYALVGDDGIRMVEPAYVVDITQDLDTKAYSGTLKITDGTDGYGIDYDSFISKLIERISADDYSEISSELTTTVAPEIDVDKIHDQVYAVATDATRTYDGTGAAVYTEDIMGVDFDVTNAKSKVAAGGTEWSFNLSLTQPAVTLRALKADTFPDLLASYYTSFNAGNVARTSNIKKACEYISGMIMQPGDIFSFNDTVGERTPERGFSKATVYSSEGTDEDYGGGICQVSSTLFYTSVLANLKVEKRSNHLYTVSYMKVDGVQVFGNDATVNWGTTDMQFSNNKEFPIKLELYVEGDSVYCNIWGTWDGWTAEYKYMEPQDELTYPSTIYRKAKAGKNNQAGQMGRTTYSYRVVYYEGVEKDRYRELKSVYRPLSYIKYVSPGQLPGGCSYDVAYGGTGGAAWP